MPRFKEGSEINKEGGVRNAILARTLITGTIGLVLALAAWLIDLPNPTPLQVVTYGSGIGLIVVLLVAMAAVWMMTDRKR